METAVRKPSPSDVTDDEWAFVLPYLVLMSETAPQRTHSLREVFNGVRWITRTGAQWRMLPNDLPPWHTVYQPTQRWMRAGVFDTMVHDRRVLIRVGLGRTRQPSAAIFDGPTVQSRRRAGNAQAMTAPNGATAARRMWRSTHAACG